MKDLFISIIGAYVLQPDVTGIAALDFPWIICALFLATILVGGLWAAVRIIVGVLHD